MAFHTCGIVVHFLLSLDSFVLVFVIGCDLI